MVDVDLTLPSAAILGEEVAWWLKIIRVSRVEIVANPDVDSGHDFAAALNADVPWRVVDADHSRLVDSITLRGFRGQIALNATVESNGKFLRIPIRLGRGHSPRRCRMESRMGNHDRSRMGIST